MTLLLAHSVVGAPVAFCRLLGSSLDLVILPFFMRLRSLADMMRTTSPFIAYSADSIRPSTRPIAAHRTLPLGIESCKFDLAWSSRIHLPARPSLGRVLLPPPPAARFRRPQRYYAGSDASPARTRRQGLSASFALPSEHPTPSHAVGSDITISSTSVYPTGCRHPGFVFESQTRRTTTPKRVRYPAGCSFASGCSPPRLPQSRSRTTQLPSATRGVTSHRWDFHLLTKQHRRRTIPGSRENARPGMTALSFRSPHGAQRNAGPPPRISLRSIRATHFAHHPSSGRRTGRPVATARSMAMVVSRLMRASPGVVCTVGSPVAR